MAQYAGVIIDISHSSLDKVFQYRVPERFQGKIEPGTRVLVPFGRGKKIRTAYVVELSEQPVLEEDRIREIIRPDPQGTSVDSERIVLAGKIRERYGGTMIQALKTVMPVSKKTTEKKKRSVGLAVSHEEAASLKGQFEKKHYTAKARVLSALLEQSPVPYEALTGKLHVTANVIQRLQEDGIVSVEEVRTYRNPLDRLEKHAHPVKLNDCQRKIAAGIEKEFLAGDHRPVLIRGVTGSGKTEVYMEVIARFVQRGKQAIVLIPEIALTFQTLMRFYGRFGERVSVLNSRMSAGERYDQFQRAREGQLDVMIGPRSALFTPFPHLGVIIIDEEHEASYKSETVPRYHAREVAKIRAEMNGACLVLGSATPSVESYYHARKGDYRLFEMTERVQKRPLPEVYTVDLRQELRSGNRSILSRKLRELMQDRLKKKEQIMLFLNRRGVAGFVSCRSCGQVIRCPHCDVSLSLHNNGRLVCHYCGHEERMPDQCPSCGSPYIGTFKAGTQKIESYIRKEFPEAKVLRMDADTTRRKGSYEKILSAFANGEADILIGTQMIVKGHDFPSVTLVGVLAADLSLHVPDFRASERTFQLLTQAAGRAGRGSRPGEVVIQTYQPQHYSIAEAAKQDYPAFYKQEILYRKLMHYPPAASMLLLRIEGPDERAAGQAAQVLKTQIAYYLREEDPKDWQVIGPADAVIARIKDIYRKTIHIKAADEKKLIQMKNALEQRVLPGERFRNVSVQFDLNPMNG